ncbi:MAG: hypothetical protein ACLRUO_03750 [Beduini sp.]|uniref:hypothetical protein n=1 Tax=Beduini sp. TaxID=1922300 RepID=UPI0011CAF907
MKQKEKFGTKRTQKKLLKILGLLCVIILVLGSFTFAKYFNLFDSDKIIGRPDGFFFESDYLTVNNTEHTMENWNTDKDYSFVIDIRNFQDTLKSAESDITYKLTISELGTNVNATLNGTAVDADSEFTMTANSPITDQLLITIPKGKTPSDKKITIQATTLSSASNGYTKTIGAVFSLVPNNTTFDLQLENHKDYYDLLVGVAKNSEVMEITWPASFTPDTTVKELLGANATSRTVQYTTTSDDSSARLRFFVTGTLNKDEYFIVKDKSGTTKQIKISEAK